MLWVELSIQDLQEWPKFGNICTNFLNKSSTQTWDKKVKRTIIWNGGSRYEQNTTLNYKIYYIIVKKLRGVIFKEVFTKIVED